MTEKVAKKEKISRQAMPEQSPQTRRRNFKEVPLGYTEELAVKEAERCLARSDVVVLLGGRMRQVA